MVSLVDQWSPRADDWAAAEVAGPLSAVAESLRLRRLAEECDGEGDDGRGHVAVVGVTGRSGTLGWLGLGVSCEPVAGDIGSRRVI